MKLEDLTAAWREADRRLMATEALVRRIHVDALAGRAHRALGRFRVLVGVELVTAAVMTLAGAGALRATGVSAFVLGSTIGMLVIAAAIVASSVWQLVMISGIDDAGAVIPTQRRLGRLRAHRIFGARWLLLLGPLLWLPALAVLMRGCGGVDLGLVLDANYISGNLAFGVAFVPLAISVCRRLAPRFGGRPWVQRLVDDLAGRSLVTALRFVGEMEG